MAPSPPRFATSRTVPTTVSAGEYGMKDYHDPTASTLARPTVHSLDDLTPYLGLRARLSQVWINRWTILILLVLARVLLAIGNLRERIDAAEAEALSACTSVESMGSAMASMPHYMAQGTNHLAARGVEKAVHGLEQSLFLTITGLEEIFVFWVNMMYGTYECLITFAVGGAAHAAIAVTEDAANFLNKTLGSISDDINTNAADFSSDLNKFISGLASIPNAFGANYKAPQIDLSKEMGALHNVQLPSDLTDQLNKLNASIPTFSQVQNFTDGILRTPFEDIKTLLNSTLGPFTFDESVFPVPQKEQLTFCTDDQGIGDFFDGLYTLADTARKIFIVVLLVAAVAACVPMALLEIRRWRSFRQRAIVVSQNARDPMDAVYIASRPYTAQTGLRLGRNFSSSKRQILMRWFVAYITSLPALLLIAIALAGLFSCLCQYILLKAVQREVPALAGQVGAFADLVVNKLNNASDAWANGTNTEILKVNNDINGHMLGWVNTSTSAVNNTLNQFINTTTKVLHDAFGGTPLEDPVQQVFNCLIGLKVQKIEDGLTWIHDHAHIDFPLFPNDTFSEGAAKALSHNNNGTGTNAQNDSFLADPGSGASDKITAAVVTLVSKLEAGIRNEALIAAMILIAYLLIVVMGLGRVLFRLCRRERGRAEGGVTYAGDLDGDHDNSATARPMVDAFSSAAPRQFTGPLASNAPRAPPDAFKAYDDHQSWQETGTVIDDGEPLHARSATPVQTAYHTGVPAPAYESPEKYASTIRHDEKTGFAGQRSPPRQHGSRGVVSEYGILETGKVF